MTGILISLSTREYLSPAHEHQIINVRFIQILYQVRNLSLTQLSVQNLVEIKLMFSNKTQTIEVFEISRGNILISFKGIWNLVPRILRRLLKEWLYPGDQPLTEEPEVSELLISWIHSADELRFSDTDSNLQGSAIRSIYGVLFEEPLELPSSSGSPNVSAIVV